MLTRVPVLDVRPQIEGGRFPAKATIGESVWIQARVFSESRSVVGAAAILTGPDGADRPAVPLRHLDNDFCGADVTADVVGAWSFRIESWTDPYATWARDAPLKIDAGVDVALTLAEGVALLERSTCTAVAFRDGLATLADVSLPAPDRLRAGMSVAPCLQAMPLRDQVDSTTPFPLFVDRRRALYGAWYEMFPRSEGARREADGSVRAGTLRTAARRLADVAAMGFDVVYLPPIHPIGRINRKGRDNALVATPGDPGSPWAIGSAAGGHDAIHPELGTLEDFGDFIDQAGALGIEVALDFALQCAPDHPWVGAHPEWFTTRIDGSIAYAENPPKKYQDIYPLNFDNDPEGLYAEIVRILRLWIDRGVAIFRVDNPHTKPLWLWERLLREFRISDPDVIFLAEAFTVPAMLHALGMVGFQQSYTYITWREGKAETGDYLAEVARETSDFLRPNFFVNTPDILPRHLQSGSAAMFKSRAVLAATGSPSWGMYAGFELLEHEPVRPGSEEYLHSEKYEIKVRDWVDPGIAPFIARLNGIRRRHPALQQLRHLYVHGTDDDTVLCFSKRAGEDIVVVVIDLDPGAAKTVRLSINAADLGLQDGEPLVLLDELSGQAMPADAVTLDPEHPARIFATLPPTP